jgi:hypothetical protein
MALKAPEISIEPARTAHEFGMRPDFDNAAIQQADDAIAAAHRGQTVSDDDDCAVLGDPAASST